MRSLLLSVAVLGAMSGAAMANRTARSMSTAGQPPQVWDHEPGPNDRLNRYQVLYIDDHSCPAGQIKKFTAGAKQFGVHATRECVVR